MASTPPENEAFLREVDEAVRTDELLNIWKRWGRWLVGGVLVALALFGAYLWWDSRQQQQSGLDGEKLSQALETLAQTDSPEAEAQLKELAASDIEGYRATAKMALAALAGQRGNLEAAAKGFGEVASDKDFAQPWRDLALIRQTATELDSIKPQQVIERLKPLAVAGNPWFGSAGEMVALSYIKLGQPELAAKLFNDIAKDETVPQTIRSRAVQMSSGLEAGTVKPASGEVTEK